MAYQSTSDYDSNYDSYVTTTDDEAEERNLIKEITDSNQTRIESPLEISNNPEEQASNVSNPSENLNARGTLFQRKEFAVSTRWEREQAERSKRMSATKSCVSCEFNNFMEFLFVACCCCARKIGGMFSILERRDGTPILITGPCWPFCAFVTIPLISGISGLVCYFIVLNPNSGLPRWFAIIYIPLIAATLSALICVGCRDPGLMERVTDEEAGNGGWFWNEQVASFRPHRATYCKECKAIIEDYDHLCPWTGTGIGRKNIFAFKIFVIFVNMLCYVTIGIVSYSIIVGIQS